MATDAKNALNDAIFALNSGVTLDAVSVTIESAIESLLKLSGERVSDTVIAQADSALEARELIKGKVLENCELSSREAADAIAEAVKCDVVQVIGSKFVLYRPKEKDPVIKLPKVR